MNGGRDMTQTGARTANLRTLVAFILGHADQHGAEIVSVSARDGGVHAQVAWQGDADGPGTVDRLADALRLEPDNGMTSNYDRRGPVDLDGSRVDVAFYCGRPAK